jgi:hypothetical protein
MFKGFETSCSGLQVAQPAYSDFVELLKSSRRHLQACQSRLQRAGEHLTVRRQADLENAEAIIRDLEAKENDIERYQTSMDIGVVVKSGFRTVEWNGRKCLLDYALYKIQKRQPDAGSTFDDVPPPEGHPSTLDWENNPISLQDLSWDMYVKKRGRSTGVTYGVIAGVYAVMRAGGDDSIRREMWALPEALSTKMYSFSEAGDSGAVAITPDGMAVGIVIGGWTVAFDGLKSLIRPTGMWDVEDIPSCRNDDGTTNFLSLLSHAMSRPIVLIESIAMVFADIAKPELKIWAP